MCMYIYIYICVCICLYNICMYVYIYIYIHTFVLLALLALSARETAESVEFKTLEDLPLGPSPPKFRIKGELRGSQGRGFEHRST